jgi:hypothetical protein
MFPTKRARHILWLLLVTATIGCNSGSPNPVGVSSFSRLGAGCAARAGSLIAGCWEGTYALDVLSDPLGAIDCHAEGPVSATFRQDGINVFGVLNAVP